jgi:hypothetical protein
VEDLMAYQRKTKDVWRVQQYTGSQYGWETVCEEETYKEARERKLEYRENQPEYPVRVSLGREKIEAE